MERRLYLIYATENEYEGLHGYEDYVIEEATEDEANRDGRVLSEELIESYSPYVFTYLSGIELGSDEYYEAIGENTCWEVYPLKFKKPLTYDDIDFLYDELNRYGLDEFLIKYEDKDDE